MDMHDAAGYLDETMKRAKRKNATPRGMPLGWAAARRRLWRRGWEELTGMTIAEGFKGERIRVLSPAAVGAALAAPATEQLTVTACGYYPRARRHGKVRPEPIDDTVVLVCVDGRGWCDVGGARHQVRAGEVAVLPAGAPHAYAADLDQPWTIWWLHVRGVAVAGLLSAADVSADRPVRACATNRAAELVDEVIRWVELDETDPSLLSASGAAWHLLALIGSGRRATEAGADAVEATAAHLRAHLHERVSLDDLAARVGLSTSHLAALFVARMGVPPLRYQTVLRMARARELLDTTADTVASVARQVGYGDAYYFARQFRRVHGVSPRDYRLRGF